MKLQLAIAVAWRASFGCFPEATPISNITGNTHKRADSVVVPIGNELIKFFYGAEAVLDAEPEPSSRDYALTRNVFNAVEMSELEEYLSKRLGHPSLIATSLDSTRLVSLHSSQGEKGYFSWGARTYLALPWLLPKLNTLIPDHLQHQNMVPYTDIVIRHFPTRTNIEALLAQLGRAIAPASNSTGGQMPRRTPDQKM